MGIRRSQHGVRTFVAVLLVVTACSSGDAQDSDLATSDSQTDRASESSVLTSETGSDATAPAPDATSTTQPLPVTTLPRVAESVLYTDLDTDELIEADEIPAGPGTLGEVVDAGIEAGLWNELEGLTRVLGYAVGGVAPDQVPGADEVLTGELGELLDRANGLALSGEYSDAELAGLRRWYELVAPPPDALDMLEATSQPGSLASGFRSTRSPAGNCTPVDPADFSSWAVVEGCYKVLEAAAAGTTQRVFYPDWYEADPQLATAPLAAIEALVRSVETFVNFAPVGDIDMIFSLVDTADSANIFAVATVDAQWGTASIAGACPVTAFPLGTTSLGKFQQTVAHEVWHCVQRESGYSAGVPASEKWFLEGGATYFSNVVYPQVDSEDRWLPRFDSSSRTKALFDMGYEAWVWWQFLGNREGPASVADMHQRMEQQGDGGRAAMEIYGEEFQRFVVEYMAGKVADETDGFVRKGLQYIWPPKLVVNNDDGRELEYEVEPFVAARWVIEYDKQLRVLETDQTATVGEVAMAKYEDRLDPASWKQVAPEVRSKCGDKARYALIATTHQGTHTAKIRIDKTEQAVCDPCLIGTWDLRLDTFEEMIISAAGGSLPAGTDITIGGNYYISFDDVGDLRQQRAGLKITATAQGFPVTFTIDSFGTGRYTADGENIAVLDMVDDYVNVTSPGGGSGFSDTNVFGQGGGGPYQCDDRVLKVTATGFPEITWDRVDVILQPDITVPA